MTSIKTFQRKSEVPARSCKMNVYGSLLLTADISLMILKILQWCCCFFYQGVRMAIVITSHWKSDLLSLVSLIMHTIRIQINLPSWHIWLERRIKLSFPKVSKIISVMIIDKVHKLLQLYWSLLGKAVMTQKVFLKNEPSVMNKMKACVPLGFKTHT